VRASDRRSILGAIAIAVFLSALASCGSDHQVARIDDTAPITTPKPVKAGEKVPPGATFERFTGGQGRFADYAGKPLVINFWQTTCAPCLKEMPAFERVHRALGAGVQFLGIDVNDTLNSGKDYARKLGVTYDLVRDPSAELLSALGGVVLPTTVLVGADGTVLLVHASAFSENELTSAITKAFG
jgi:thiol-disulfide isomerase/thioredoxin